MLIIPVQSSEQTSAAQSQPASERTPERTPERLYVGVDIAKADFAAAIAWGGQTTSLGKTTNTAAGCAAFIASIQQGQQACGAEQVHLVVEPTGGLEAELVAAAYASGWLVTVVNTQVVRYWAQGRGRRAKTDRQDALLLAAYGASEKPEPQQPLDEHVAELASLLSRKTDLEQLLRSERNRHGQLRRRTPAAVRQSIERTITALEQELAAIDAAIQQLQHQHPFLRRQIDQLRSVPGIGAKSAPRILVLLHQFLCRTNGHGSAKQLVAFLGLDPTPYQSGSSVHRHATISRRGNAAFRSLLYFCALGGVGGHNPLAAFYHSLLARGKPKKLALVACARKTITWAWAVFSHDAFFDAKLLAKA
jgi:transposase